MAIDTENKRRSTLRLPWMPLVLPLADGGVSLADKAHMYVYARAGDSGGVGPPAGVPQLDRRYVIPISP